jgi:hypothetical protein
MPIKPNHLTGLRCPECSYFQRCDEVLSPIELMLTSLDSKHREIIVKAKLNCSTAWPCPKCHEANMVEDVVW